METAREGNSPPEPVIVKDGGDFNFYDLSRRLERYD